MRSKENNIAKKRRGDETTTKSLNATKVEIKIRIECANEVIKQFIVHDVKLTLIERFCSLSTPACSTIEISRLTMTGDQGTLDSSLAGGYLSKASNFGPAIFKTIELVS